MTGRSWPNGRAILTVAAAAVVASLAAAAHASTNSGGGACAGSGRASVDPFALYGPEMNFEIRRGGEPVGRHDVTFERRGADLVVESRFDVAVRVFGVAVYTYTYVSTDVWRDGCLTASRSEIDDDGERTIIEAVREGDKLVVRGPEGTAAAGPAIIPTNHWYAGVLGERQVLNTLTGTVDDVAILDRGPAIKPVNGTPKPVRHYAYTGDLDTEVWYDDRGRWVALAFKGRDGSAIELVCQRCAGETSASR
jgi:hypothetical protein